MAGAAGVVSLHRRSVAPVEDPTELSADQLAGRLSDAVGLNLGMDDAAATWCAAVGATLMLWRNGPIEDIHAGHGKQGGIPDAEMMRANVATTRCVVAALAGSGTDWRSLALALTVKDRPVAGGTLADLVGPRNVGKLRRHALRIAANLDALMGDKGWPWVRVYCSVSGANQNWFGVPWWPEYVAVFVDEVAGPDSALNRFLANRGARLSTPPLPISELASALVAAPEELSWPALAWCINEAQIGYVPPEIVRARWKANGSPRWAPPLGLEAT